MGALSLSFSPTTATATPSAERSLEPIHLHTSIRSSRHGTQLDDAQRGRQQARPVTGGEGLLFCGEMQLGVRRGQAGGIAWGSDREGGRLLTHHRLA